MRTEWSNKDSLEIPETTAGYGSVSWSDYKTGTSCDSVVLEAEPIRDGHWLKNGYRYCECSVCHHEGNISGVDNYCWNCGAKMDGGENEANAEC